MEVSVQIEIDIQEVFYNLKDEQKEEFILNNINSADTEKILNELDDEETVKDWLRGKGYDIPYLEF